MQESLAVMGVGSPFGDDNVAHIVIECLQQLFMEHNVKDKVHVQYYDRPGIYLLDYLQHFKTVHLIDAVISQQQPGTLYRYENSDDFQIKTQPLSSHDIALAEVLKLGKILNCLPKNLIIHGIEIAIDESHSKTLNTACQTLAWQIFNEITNVKGSV